MMNMNDICVAQKIAQERYQRLIREREVTWLTRLDVTQPSLTTRLLDRLGQQLERWGQDMQRRGAVAPQDNVCRT